MPGLEVKHEGNYNEEDELDLTTTSLADLLVSRVDVSPTPSISSEVLPVQTKSDSVNVPHITVSFSIGSSPSLNDIVDDLERYIRIFNNTFYLILFSRPDPTKDNNRPQFSIDDDNLEQKIQHTLAGPDVQQQVRASIVSLPGDTQYLQSISLSRKRSWLSSKLLLSYLVYIK